MRIMFTGIKMEDNYGELSSSIFDNCIYNHRTTKTNQKYPSVNL